MSTANRVFWAVVLVQLSFLLGWAGYHEYVRSHAPVLLLQARPVDPQDLLRGDYMVLRYEIGDVPLDPATSARGEVWVVLEKRGDHHVALRATRERPVPTSNQVVVRGTESSRGWNRRARTVIEYGIEKYFVPEGRGTPTFTKMEVEASVGPTQRLYIRRVLLDGKNFP